MVLDYTKTPWKMHEDLTMHIISFKKDLLILIGECVHNKNIPSYGQSFNKDLWLWDLARIAMYHHYTATKNESIPW